MAHSLLVHPSSGGLPYISVHSYDHFDHTVTFSSSKCFEMVDM